MELLKDENYFKSSESKLIGALNVYGYPIEAIDKSNSRNVIFSIKRDRQLDELIKAFWSRELRVDPLAYHEALKNIQSRIHND